jgi:transcriptional regulator with XRE-family HTH domain
MSEYSYKNWAAMSDKALLQHIGKFIKHHRLEQNKSQDKLATDAGISRSTLSLLERGEPVALLTLIQVLRMLDKLYILSEFNVEPTISPMMVAEMELKKRKRAGKKGKSDNSYTSEW